MSQKTKNRQLLEAVRASDVELARTLRAEGAVCPIVVSMKSDIPEFARWSWDTADEKGRRYIALELAHKGFEKSYTEMPGLVVVPSHLCASWVGTTGLIDFVVKNLKRKPSKKSLYEAFNGACSFNRDAKVLQHFMDVYGICPRTEDLNIAIRRGNITAVLFLLEHVEPNQESYSAAAPAARDSPLWRHKEVIDEIRRRLEASGNWNPWRAPYSGNAP